MRERCNLSFPILCHVFVPREEFFIIIVSPAIFEVTETQKCKLIRFSLFQGHIKGYISHQHQKLVVSKQNPFPPLSTVC